MYFAYLPHHQVCPPGLHISLGLYLKHFNSFEGACHDLDIQAAAVLAHRTKKIGLLWHLALATRSSSPC